MFTASIEVAIRCTIPDNGLDPSNLGSPFSRENRNKEPAPSTAAISPSQGKEKQGKSGSSSADGVKNTFLL